VAEIASSPSESAAVTPVADEAWLKDPLDAAGNTTIGLGETALELTSIEPQGVFAPLGRPDPVVLSGTIGTEAGVLVLTLTPAQRRAVEQLRARQRTLLLQTPFGDHLYIRLGGERRRTRLFGMTSGVERYRIPFVEVRRP
jgi:hypothetical protein